MQMTGMRRLASLAALVLLAGCGRLIPQTDTLPPPRPLPAPTPAPTPGPAPTPTPTPAAATALLQGVAKGRGIGSLDITQQDANDAMASFVESCPRVTSRQDGSGLTRPADWQPACTAARSWSRTDGIGFFKTHFETAVVGDGAAFATGYYEPEIAGVRTRRSGYDVPVYSMPTDLVRGWPDDMPQSERTGQPPLGRYDSGGRFVSYFERTEIENGALAGKGLEIGWAADPIELFFLQIQGSGRLRGPDGSVTRIGYAGQNGREYVGIGSVMRERGLIGSGPGKYSGSMQGIMQYLRENPEEGRRMMQLNKSWIFFRVIEGDGPLGALSVPVRRESSVATDPRYVPLGAPVFLSMDNRQANGLWIAQDTGGAIKGPNRFDTFWGAGEDARLIAGGMSARGQAVLLLPKGTLRRLGVE